MFQTILGGDSADAAVLLNGKIVFIEPMNIGRKARAVTVVHTAGGNAVSQKQPAVADTLRNIMNIKIDGNRAIFLVIRLCDTDADPVVSGKLYDMLTG